MCVRAIFKRAKQTSPLPSDIFLGGFSTSARRLQGVVSCLSDASWVTHWKQNRTFQTADSIASVTRPKPSSGDRTSAFAHCVSPLWFSPPYFTNRSGLAAEGVRSQKPMQLSRKTAVRKIIRAKRCWILNIDLSITALLMAPVSNCLLGTINGGWRRGLIEGIWGRRRCVIFTSLLTRVHPNERKSDESRCLAQHLHRQAGSHLQLPSTLTRLRELCLSISKKDIYEGLIRLQGGLRGGLERNIAAFYWFLADL